MMFNTKFNELVNALNEVDTNKNKDQDQEDDLKETKEMLNKIKESSVQAKMTGIDIIANKLCKLGISEELIHEVRQELSVSEEAKRELKDDDPTPINVAEEKQLLIAKLREVGTLSALNRLAMRAEALMGEVKAGDSNSALKLIKKTNDALKEWRFSDEEKPKADYYKAKIMKPFIAALNEQDLDKYIKATYFSKKMKAVQRKKSFGWITKMSYSPKITIGSNLIMQLPIIHAIVILQDEGGLSDIATKFKEAYKNKLNFELLFSTGNTLEEEARQLKASLAEEKERDLLGLGPMKPEKEIPEHLRALNELKIEYTSKPIDVQGFVKPAMNELKKVEFSQQTESKLGFSVITMILAQCNGLLNNISRDPAKNMKSAWYPFIKAAYPLIQELQSRDDVPMNLDAYDHLWNLHKRMHNSGHVLPISEKLFNKLKAFNLEMQDQKLKGEYPYYENGFSEKYFSLATEECKPGVLVEKTVYEQSKVVVEKLVSERVKEFSSLLDQFKSLKKDDREYTADEEQKLQGLIKKIESVKAGAKNATLFQAKNTRSNMVLNRGVADEMKRLYETEQKDIESAKSFLNDSQLLSEAKSSIEKIKVDPSFQQRMKSSRNIIKKLQELKDLPDRLEAQQTDLLGRYEAFGEFVNHTEKEDEKKLEASLNAFNIINKRNRDSAKKLVEYLGNSYSQVSRLFSSNHYMSDAVYNFLVKYYQYSSKQKSDVDKANYLNAFLPLIRNGNLIDSEGMGLGPLGLSRILNNKQTIQSWDPNQFIETLCNGEDRNPLLYGQNADFIYQYVAIRFEYARAQRLIDENAIVMRTALVSLKSAISENKHEAAKDSYKAMLKSFEKTKAAVSVAQSRGRESKDDKARMAKLQDALEVAKKDLDNAQKLPGVIELDVTVSQVEEKQAAADDTMPTFVAVLLETLVNKSSEQFQQLEKNIMKCDTNFGFMGNLAAKSQQLRSGFEAVKNLPAELISCSNVVINTCRQSSTPDAVLTAIQKLQNALEPVGSGQLTDVVLLREPYEFVAAALSAVNGLDGDQYESSKAIIENLKAKLGIPPGALDNAKDLQESVASFENAIKALRDNDTEETRLSLKQSYNELLSKIDALETVEAKMAYSSVLAQIYQLKLNDKGGVFDLLFNKQKAVNKLISTEQKLENCYVAIAEEKAKISVTKPISFDAGVDKLLKVKLNEKRVYDLLKRTFGKKTRQKNANEYKGKAGLQDLHDRLATMRDTIRHKGIDKPGTVPIEAYILMLEKDFDCAPTAVRAISKDPNVSKAMKKFAELVDQLPTHPGADIRKQKKILNDIAKIPGIQEVNLCEYLKLNAALDKRFGVSDSVERNPIKYITESVSALNQRRSATQSQAVDKPAETGEDKKPDSPSDQPTEDLETNMSSTDGTPKPDALQELVVNVQQAFKTAETKVVEQISRSSDILADEDIVKKYIKEFEQGIAHIMTNANSLDFDSLSESKKQLENANSNYMKIVEQKTLIQTARSQLNQFTRGEYSSVIVEESQRQLAILDNYEKQLKTIIDDGQVVLKLATFSLNLTESACLSADCVSVATQHDVLKSPNVRNARLQLGAANKMFNKISDIIKQLGDTESSKFGDLVDTINKNAEYALPSAYRNIQDIEEYIKNAKTNGKNIEADERDIAQMENVLANIEAEFKKFNDLTLKQQQALLEKVERSSRSVQNVKLRNPDGSFESFRRYQDKLNRFDLDIWMPSKNRFDDSCGKQAKDYRNQLEVAKKEYEDAMKLLSDVNGHAQAVSGHLPEEKPNLKNAKQELKNAEGVIAGFKQHFDAFNVAVSEMKKIQDSLPESRHKELGVDRDFTVPKGKLNAQYLVAGGAIERAKDQLKAATQNVDRRNIEQQLTELMQKISDAVKNAEMLANENAFNKQNLQDNVVKVEDQLKQLTAVGKAIDELGYVAVLLQKKLPFQDPLTGTTQKDTLIILAEKAVKAKKNAVIEVKASLRRAKEIKETLEKIIQNDAKLEVAVKTYGEKQEKFNQAMKAPDVEFVSNAALISEMGELYASAEKLLETNAKLAKDYSLPAEEKAIAGKQGDSAKLKTEFETQLQQLVDSQKRVVDRIVAEAFAAATEATAAATEEKHDPNMAKKSAATVNDLLNTLKAVEKSFEENTKPNIKHKMDELVEYTNKQVEVVESHFQTAESAVARAESFKSYNESLTRIASEVKANEERVATLQTQITKGFAAKPIQYPELVRNLEALATLLDAREKLIKDANARFEALKEYKPNPNNQTLAQVRVAETELNTSRTFLETQRARVGSLAQAEFQKLLDDILNRGDTFARLMPSSSLDKINQAIGGEMKNANQFSSDDQFAPAKINASVEIFNRHIQTIEYSITKAKRAQQQILETISKEDKYEERVVKIVRNPSAQIDAAKAECRKSMEDVVTRLESSLQAAKTNLDTVQTAMTQKIQQTKDQQAELGRILAGVNSFQARCELIQNALGEDEKLVYSDLKNVHREATIGQVVRQFKMQAEFIKKSKDEVDTQVSALEVKEAKDAKPVNLTGAAQRVANANAALANAKLLNGVLKSALDQKIKNSREHIKTGLKQVNERLKALSARLKNTSAIDQPKIANAVILQVKEVYTLFARTGGLFDATKANEIVDLLEGIDTSLISFFDSPIMYQSLKNQIDKFRENFRDIRIVDITERAIDEPDTFLNYLQEQNKQDQLNTSVTDIDDTPVEVHAISANEMKHLRGDTQEKLDFKLPDQTRYIATYMATIHKLHSELSTRVPDHKRDWRRREVKLDAKEQITLRNKKLKQLKLIIDRMPSQLRASDATGVIPFKDAEKAMIKDVFAGLLTLNYEGYTEHRDASALPEDLMFAFKLVAYCPELLPEIVQDNGASDPLCSIMTEAVSLRYTEPVDVEKMVDVIQRMSVVDRNLATDSQENIAVLLTKELVQKILDKTQSKEEKERPTVKQLADLSVALQKQLIAEGVDKRKRVLSGCVQQVSKALAAKTHLAQMRYFTLSDVAESGGPIELSDEVGSPTQEFKELKVGTEFTSTYVMGNEPSVFYAGGRLRGPSQASFTYKREKMPDHADSAPKGSTTINRVSRQSYRRTRTAFDAILTQIRGRIDAELKFNAQLSTDKRLDESEVIRRALEKPMYLNVSSLKERKERDQVVRMDSMYRAICSEIASKAGLDNLGAMRLRVMDKGHELDVSQLSTSRLGGNVSMAKLDRDTKKWLATEDKTFMSRSKKDQPGRPLKTVIALAQKKEDPLFNELKKLKAMHGDTAISREEQRFAKALGALKEVKDENGKEQKLEDYIDNQKVEFAEVSKARREALKNSAEATVQIVRLKQEAKGAKLDETKQKNVNYQQMQKHRYTDQLLFAKIHMEAITKAQELLAKDDVNLGHPYIQAIKEFDEAVKNLPKIPDMKDYDAEDKTKRVENDYHTAKLMVRLHAVNLDACAPLELKSPVARVCKFVQNEFNKLAEYKLTDEGEREAFEERLKVSECLIKAVDVERLLVGYMVEATALAGQTIPAGLQAAIDKSNAFLTKCAEYVTDPSKRQDADKNQLRELESESMRAAQEYTQSKGESVQKIEEAYSGRVTLGRR